MEVAAVQCGIPIEEVYQYVTDRIGKVDTLNFELRLVGQDAIKNAIKKLRTIAKGGQRACESEELCMDPMGSPMKTVEKLNSDDLEAAKALAKFGIDALKLAKAGAAPRKDEPNSPDLFDAKSDPWKLKKPE